MSAVNKYYAVKIILGKFIEIKFAAGLPGNIPLTLKMKTFSLKGLTSGVKINSTDYPPNINKWILLTLTVTEKTEEK